MLSKKYRLSRSQVVSVIKNGTRFYAPNIIMYLFKADKPSFAATVSKKVCPLATDRNLVRRRIYSAILPYIGKVKDCACVFMIKNGPNKEPLSYDEIETEISNLLKSSGML